MGKGRALTIVLVLVGVFCITMLVAWVGFQAVARTLFALKIGGIVAFLAVHLVIQALLGLAWWAIIQGDGCGVMAFVGARIIRDAGGDVLPLSQLGGYVLGSRVLGLYGFPMVMAVASTVVDVTLELAGQIVTIILGLGMLVRLHPECACLGPIMGGLGVAIVATGAFIFLQLRGTKGLKWLPGLVAKIYPYQQAIQQIAEQPCRLGLGFGLHLAAWLALVGEGWLALYLLGSPLGLGAVLALESMVFAVRSVGFAIPNALAVQEGGYVLIGAWFGLGPESALALSLMKRARDIVIGVPALLVWQAVEVGRLRRASPSGLRYDDGAQ